MSISPKIVVLTIGLVSLAAGILVVCTPGPKPQIGTTSQTNLELEGRSETDQKSDAGEKMQQVTSAVNADLLPAGQAFPNVAEAIEAVERGIEDHNDLLIEQFRALDADCAWREEFYSALRGKLSDSKLTREKIHFMGEILATSERPENVRFLFARLAENSDPNLVDAFGHAAELSCGGSEITKVLAAALTSENQRVRDAAVGALTNQGSREAAQILYEHTKNSGAGARYDGLGIGLGEMIPEEEAMPFLAEMAAKRDIHSPLAVYALLNSGLDGLKQVFSIYGGDAQSELDRAILRDAVSHVLLDKESESFVRERLEGPASSAGHEFAGKILERFNADPPPETDEGAP